MLFPKMVPCLRENEKFLAEAKFVSREVQMAVNLGSLANTSSLHAAINISGSNDSTTTFPHLLKPSEITQHNNEILTCIGP